MHEGLTTTNAIVVEILWNKKLKLKQPNYEKNAKLYLIKINKKAGLKIKNSLLGVVALGGS